MNRKEDQINVSGYGVADGRRAISTRQCGRQAWSGSTKHYRRETVKVVVCASLLSSTSPSPSAASG